MIPRHPRPVFRLEVAGLALAEALKHRSIEAGSLEVRWICRMPVAVGDQDAAPQRGGTANNTCEPSS